MDVVDNIISILERHVKKHGVAPITNEDILKVIRLAIMQKEIYEDDDNMSSIPWELYD